MPNVSIYLKEKVYRAALREAEEKGLRVSELVRMKVEDIYEQTAISTKRAKIRPGIRE